MDYELTDDEDAPLEEEREARRMQKEAAMSLKASDLGLDEDESDQDGDESDESDGDAAMELRVGKATRMEVEKVDRDVRDKLDQIKSDAPELLSLLDQLQQAMYVARAHI